MCIQNTNCAYNVAVLLALLARASCLTHRHIRAKAKQESNCCAVLARVQWSQSALAGQSVDAGESNATRKRKLGSFEPADRKRNLFWGKFNISSVVDRCPLFLTFPSLRRLIKQSVRGGF